MTKRWIALLTPLVLLAGFAFWTQHELERAPEAKPLPAPRAEAVASASMPLQVLRTVPQVPEPAVLGPDGAAAKLAAPYSPVPVPKSETFAMREVADPAALAPLMPAPFREQLVHKQLALSCDSPKLTVYERAGSAARLIVSDCRYLSYENSPQRALVLDYHYRPMWIWDAQGLRELPGLSPHFAFMYESSSVQAVTDLNRNGLLELWLTGTMYECDGAGEDDEPCNGEGLWIVELDGRRVQVLDPARLIGSQTQ